MEPRDPRRDGDAPVTGFGFFGQVYDTAVAAAPWNHGKSLLLLGLGLFLVWLGYLDRSRVFMGLAALVVLVSLGWLVSGVRSDLDARRLSRRSEDGAGPLS